MVTGNRKSQTSLEIEQFPRRTTLFWLYVIVLLRAHRHKIEIYLGTPIAHLLRSKYGRIIIFRSIIHRSESVEKLPGVKCWSEYKAFELSVSPSEAYMVTSESIYNCTPSDLRLVVDARLLGYFISISYFLCLVWNRLLLICSSSELVAQRFRTRVVVCSAISSLERYSLTALGLVSRFSATSRSSPVN